jgi:translocation protein SEC72
MELPSALIPFALATSGSPDNHAALLCPEHKIEKCSACDVDFSAVNYLQRFLRLAPADAVPPPPNNVHPQRAEQVRQAKEQGNVRG